MFRLDRYFVIVGIRILIHLAGLRARFLIREASQVTGREVRMLLQVIKTFVPATPALLGDDEFLSPSGAGW